jgi:hypothetical protein
LRRRDCADLALLLMTCHAHQRERAHALDALIHDWRPPRAAGNDGGAEPRMIALI